jgi:hypothetical protein
VFASEAFDPPVDDGFVERGQNGSETHAGHERAHPLVGRGSVAFGRS